jgi:cysteine synthase
LVDKTLIDEELIVSTQEAKERAARLAKENGLLVGISSGANVLAAERWIKENNPDGVVVTFLCDRGERYLSCM